MVGRNGSGKSSFAGAAELALAGTSSRWSGRGSKEWLDGWPNLHYSGERQVELQLCIEGTAGNVTVSDDQFGEAGVGEFGTGAVVGCVERLIDVLTLAGEGVGGGGDDQAPGPVTEAFVALHRQRCWQIRWQEGWQNGANRVWRARAGTFAPRLTCPFPGSPNGVRTRVSILRERADRL